MWSIFKYKELLVQLVLKDIKLKYRRSYLGYLWSILNPLLMMGVLVIVFSNIFRFDIPNYPVYLLTGQVIFGFVSEATNTSVNAVVENAPLLKKTYLPKYIFTLSKVTSSLVNLLFSLVALLVVILVSDVTLTLNVLYSPLIVFQVYIFILGLSLTLSSLSVFFRDIQYLWGVFITMWMYMTPIFYPVTIIPDIYRDIYETLNPMCLYLSQFRDVILYGNNLSLINFTYGMGIAIISLLIGLFIFNRKKDSFILYI